jgi:preprotein translocase SecE subunit
MPADKAVEEKSRRRRRRRDPEIEADAEAEVEYNEDGTPVRGISERKGRVTPGRRVHTDDGNRGNFLTRFGRGMIEYFRGVSDELSKVVWPDREDTIRLSRIVLSVTIAAALILGAISFLFTELFILGIRDDQPIVFVIFGAVVVAGYFVWTRRIMRQSEF